MTFSDYSDTELPDKNIRYHIKATTGYVTFTQFDSVYIVGSIRDEDPCYYQHLEYN